MNNNFLFFSYENVGKASEQYEPQVWPGQKKKSENAVPSVN